MTDTIIPDVSEFQNVNFDLFHGPIIVRAHNGNRADFHWRHHADGAAQQPWWAAYQYLPATVDPAVAAYRFLATLAEAPARPFVTILDLEEGSGDQSGRQHAWLAAMTADPAMDWTYSGLYFARDHRLNDVQWIAAYGQSEPSPTHKLWQFTNAHTFPGIGACDGSVFHGSVDDLLALTNHQPGETTMKAPLLLLDDGAVIAIPADGGRPWHIPNPTVLGVLQYGGIVGAVPAAPLNKADSDSFRASLIDTPGSVGDVTGAILAALTAHPLTPKQ